ncbi:MAG TPA: hypothetical protein VKU82_16595, partial [Planctomycetaceae bacterium]|nr:hypothetical protein [Planctomycetaceae bacterium]
TDPERVPDTILSRCQRFDFGPIATATIGQRLSEIGAAEGVDIEPDAVQLVARRAAGSMRDSQSLLDQLLAFGGKTIHAADVHRLLGTAPDDRLVDLGEALTGRDRPRVLSLLEAALSSGVQVAELADQLVSYFRDLMVLACGADAADLISVGDEQRSKLQKQAAAGGLQSIVAALQLLAEAKSRMKGVTFSRVLLELALIRIATLDQLDDLAELVSQFRPKKGAPGGPAAPSHARSTSEGRPRGSSLGSGAEAPAAQAPSKPKSAPPASDSDRQIEVSNLQAAETVELTEPIPFEVGRERAIWTQVMSLLTDMSRANAKNVARTAISGPNGLVLTFPKSYDFCKQYFERSPEQLARIENAVSQVVGRPIRVALAVDEFDPQPREAEAPSHAIREQAEGKPAEPVRDRLVQRALAAFEATIVKVESATAPRSNTNSSVN